MANFNLELLKLQADLAEKTAKFYKLLIKDLEKRKPNDNFDFEPLVKSLKMNTPEGQAFKTAEDKINRYRAENGL
jgi:hypothetical protein